MYKKQISLFQNLLNNNQILMKYLKSSLFFLFLIYLSSVCAQTSIGPFVGYRVSTFNKDIFLVEYYGPEGKYTFYDNVPVFGLKINQKLYKMVDLSLTGSYYNTVLKDYISEDKNLNFTTIEFALITKIYKGLKAGLGIVYNYVTCEYWPYVFDYNKNQIYYNYNFQIGYAFKNFNSELKFLKTFPNHGLKNYFENIYGFEVSMSYFINIKK